jgi:hypothetical protein
MEEPQPQPPPIPPELETQKQPRMSLAARLLNVFAVPGQVFSELKLAPRSISNWLAPALLCTTVTAISLMIVFDQPEFKKQLEEKKAQVVASEVKAGAPTERVRILVDQFTGPAAQKCFAVGLALIGSFGSLFWWGFIMWFLARNPLKIPVPFSKSLEVAGLAMMIDTLGSLVIMLLVVNFGRNGLTSHFGPVIEDVSASRKGSLSAFLVSAFSFWVVGVRSIGLAKLTDTLFVRAGWLIVTVWILMQCFFLLIGIGRLAM